MHVPCFYINYWIICWPSRSFHTLSIVIIKSVSVVVRLGHKLPTVEKWWKLFLNIQHKQNCYCKHHEELTFTQFVLLHSHCIEAETILFLSKASIPPRIVLVPIVPDPFFGRSVAFCKNSSEPASTVEHQPILLGGNLAPSPQSSKGRVQKK